MSPTDPTFGVTGPHATGPDVGPINCAECLRMVIASADPPQNWAAAVQDHYQQAAREAGDRQC